MEVAIVVEAGQIVPFGDFLSLATIEHVLDRDRDVTGEDLQQVEVLLAVMVGIAPVDELKDPADLVLDPNRDRHQ